jgi:hypothetical protein
MFVRYNVYGWAPPKLTPEEEIEIGREIVLKGRDFYLNQAPYLSKDEQLLIESAKHYSATQKFIIRFTCILFFGAAIVFGGAKLLVIFIAATPILILSIGSLLEAYPVVPGSSIFSGCPISAA